MVESVSNERAGISARRQERERPGDHHGARRLRLVPPAANLREDLLLQTRIFQRARDHRHRADRAARQDLVSDDHHAAERRVVAKLVVVRPAKTREVTLRLLPDGVVAPAGAARARARNGKAAAARAAAAVAVPSAAPAAAASAGAGE